MVFAGVKINAYWDYGRLWDFILTGKRALGASAVSLVSIRHASFCEARRASFGATLAPIQA